ncbi:MAG: hypothetical protein GQE15_17930, partial [Archangiaceae bacterium]|nr:hypothetical protein [Archangiaceae bacterium]
MRNTAGRAWWVAVLFVWAGCDCTSVDVDGLRFPCTTDAECGADARCVANFCVVGDAGAVDAGGSDAGTAD